MTATWTAPRTWATGNLVTAADLNEQLRDNLEFLKSPPTDVDTEDWSSGSDYSTTSTSFVDVDATDLNLSITTEGGDVLVGVRVCVFGASTPYVFFDLNVDGSRQGGADGLSMDYVASAQDTFTVSFTHLIQGLSAGAHTIKLQWKVNTGTGNILSGGASQKPEGQFWAREVS